MENCATPNLDEREDGQCKESRKQERTEEAEVVASLGRPECVESETPNHRSC